MAEIKENTHFVIKVEDAKEYLSPTELGLLYQLDNQIIAGRRNDEKRNCGYYVCNRDEPYADKVLKVILDGEDAKNGVLKPSCRTCENCTRWNQAYTAPNKDFHYCDNLGNFTRKSFWCSEHENDAELEDRLDADRFDNEYC